MARKIIILSLLTFTIYVIGWLYLYRFSNGSHTIYLCIKDSGKIVCHSFNKYSLRDVDFGRFDNTVGKPFDDCATIFYSVLTFNYCKISANPHALKETTEITIDPLMEEGKLYYLLADYDGFTLYRYRGVFGYDTEVSSP
jgi:hypothetical protein